MIGIMIPVTATPAHALSAAQKKKKKKAAAAAAKKKAHAAAAAAAVPPPPLPEPVVVPAPAPAPVVNEPPPTEQPAPTEAHVSPWRTPPSHTPPPPPPEPVAVRKAGDRGSVGMMLGLNGGAIFGFSGDLRMGFGGGLEIGYRLPFLNGLIGISLTPKAFALLPASTVKGSAFSVLIPLELSANLSLGPGFARLMLGPQLAYDSVKITDATGTYVDTSWVLGFHGGLGYLFNVGVGSLGLYVDFDVIPYTVNKLPYTLTGVGARLAYVINF